MFRICVESFVCGCVILRCVRVGGSVWDSFFFICPDVMECYMRRDSTNIMMLLMTCGSRLVGGCSRRIGCRSNLLS